MPDLLIRGMQMPTQDTLLHIHADGRAVFYPFCVLDKVTEYEAVELPPHGDLIDKEKLYDLVKQRGRNWAGEFCDFECHITGNDIQNAPVIIPASKEDAE